MDSILVTGGTGNLGRTVVQGLLDDGRQVRVASRRQEPAGPGRPYEWATVDYRRGAGLDAACRGTSAVVHCASAMLGGEVRLARAVIEAARRAGSPHIVYISIVGVDRIPFSYYRTKLAAEREFEKSGLPVTILRATQFHDLIRGVLDVAVRSPLMPLPAVGSFQPIEVAEVGRRLADLAVGEPAGRVPDIGGPEVRGVRDLADSYLRATGRRRRVLPIGLPGKTVRAFRAGWNLTPQNRFGTRTFEEFLRAGAA